MHAPPGGGRIDFFDTTRVGRIIGPDLTERLARTFHCNFGSIKVGGNFRDALDYARRQGDYAKVEKDKMDKLRERLDEAVEAGNEKAIAKRGKAIENAEARNAKADEFEAEAGDPEAVLKAADLIEETARVRSGRTAERVVATEVWELPGDSTAAQRSAAAAAIVEHWRSQGHEAHAAVHGNGVVQPHMHVTATARPILADGAVDRSRLLWPTKQDVRDAREDRAELVNRHCPGAVLFDGGRHEAVGIDRKARREAGLMQRRLPRHARHREESFERTRRDDDAPARQAGRYKASREALPAREADRAARKEARSEQARKRNDRDKKRKREAAELTKKQMALITDLHKQAGRALPDLATERGQSEAWAFAREVTEAGMAAWLREEAERKAKEEREQREAERKRLADEQAETDRRVRENTERLRIEREAEKEREKEEAAKTAAQAEAKHQALRERIEAEQADDAARREYETPVETLDRLGQTLSAYEAEIFALPDGTALADHPELFARFDDLEGEIIDIERMIEDEEDKAARPVAAAWQLTVVDFTDRTEVGEDGTEVTFDRVDPPIRLRHDPGNTANWKSQAAGGERPPWLYDRPPHTLGFHGKTGRDAAAAVHRMEVHDAVRRGKPVPDEVLAFYRATGAACPADERQSAGGGAGGGFEFDGPSLVERAELDRQRQQQNTR